MANHIEADHAICVTPKGAAKAWHLLSSLFSLASVLLSPPWSSCCHIAIVAITRRW